MSFRATSILVSLALAACASPPAPVASTPIQKTEPAAPQAGACTATTRIIAGAKSPIRAKAFVTKTTKEQEAIASAVERLFAAYERASGGKFHGEVVDAKDEATKKLAKDRGLVEVALDDEPEDSPRAKRGYAGIVLDYGAEHDSIKAIAADSAHDLEYWVSTKLRELRERAEHVTHDFGIVMRGDEPPLTDALLPDGKDATMRKIVDQYFPMYRFVDVDLGKGPVPDTLAGLFVFQPDRDLDAAALRFVDDFVMLGKPVVIVASAVNLKRDDPTMRATLSTHGLEKLTAGYGLEMKRDVVIDYGRMVTVSVLTEAGPKTIRFPALLRLVAADKLGDDRMLDTRFAPFFRLPSVGFPFASSLVLHPDRQPESKLRVVARSTPASVRDTDAEVDLAPLRRWSPGGEMASSVIGAVAEGRLTSAFAAPRRAERDARVAVLSSSLFFANPFARAGNDDTMKQLSAPYAEDALVNAILVLKNTLDWMADGELASCALDARRQP